MALPGRQPIEALKNGAVGLRLEGAPILLDRRQILVDGNANVAEGGWRARLRTVGGRRIDAEMRVKSCWDSLGHGRVSILERSIKGLRPRDVHNPLTRPPGVKSRWWALLRGHGRIPIVRAVPVGAWRSPVSAPVWGTGGREFKSRRPDQQPQ